MPDTKPTPSLEPHPYTTESLAASCEPLARVPATTPTPITDACRSIVMFDLTRRFERALRSARAALARGQPDLALLHIEEALGIPEHANKV